MTSETAEFANGATELAKAKSLRSRAASLRGGVGGMYYGLSAYGSPIGNVTGISQGAAPAAEAPLGEQWGGGGTGDSGGDGGGVSAG